MAIEPIKHHLFDCVNLPDKADAFMLTLHLDMNLN